MEKEFARKVIQEVKDNPGIFYDDLISRFQDKEPNQIYMLLYGLCEPKRSANGELQSILSFTEKIEMRLVGNLLGGRRAIEMGEFRLTREEYSEERFDEIFKFWKLENI